jgi:hypothetical protein
MRRCLGFVRHAFSALASFCAPVRGFGLAFGVSGGGRLPGPENVALAGAPKIGGAASGP